MLNLLTFSLIFWFAFPWVYTLIGKRRAIGEGILSGIALSLGFGTLLIFYLLLWEKYFNWQLVRLILVFISLTGFLYGGKKVIRAIVSDILDLLKVIGHETLGLLKLKLESIVGLV